MADLELRAAERRYRASGTVADEATWLRARVRSGELSPARLTVAALAGRSAARLVLGDAAPPGPTPATWRDPRAVRGWAAHLAAAGPDVALAAALAAVRAVAPSDDVDIALALEALGQRPPDERPLEHLAVGLTMESLDYAVFLMSEVIRAYAEGTEGPEWCAAQRMNQPFGEPDPEQDVGLALFAAWRILPGHELPPGEALGVALGFAAHAAGGPGRVVAAAGDAVSAWALGG
jgi:hypothetical protein